MNAFEPGIWRNRKLEQHVENRSCYTLRQAELNLFETHKEAEKVALQFSDPVLASMLVGKKVMHLRDAPKFDFLPGESVILPADEVMCIDFPEAHLNNPTKCLALRIDQSMIAHTVEEMNVAMRRMDNEQWIREDYNFHFTNDIAIHQIIQRLIFLFTENHQSKDLFSEMMIKELIIRILQIENRNQHIHRSYEASNSSRFAFVIDFVRNNLIEHMNVSQLSELVNMSETAFYRAFKTEMGITPNAFIIEERLRHAESMLKDPSVSVKEAYLSSGFNSFSYFCRIFKKRNGMNPGKYREQMGVEKH